MRHNIRYIVAEIGMSLLAIGVGGLMIASAVNPSLVGIHKIPGIGIGVGMLIVPAVGAYMIDCGRRLEKRCLKSANRILDSVEKDKYVHTKDDVKNVQNSEYFRLYVKMKAYTSELAIYSETAANIDDDLNTFIQQR